ncbi:MAG: SdpI family protein [Cellulomonadaceae bacterium]|jgi:hypothetical protein|nr:SdpI family protein [Cellulomonadaceae bacterium]
MSLGWSFFFGMLTPVILCAVSPLFTRLSRGTPNLMMGYRTPRSLKSTRNWQEAQRLAGRYLLVVGVVFTVVALAAFGYLFATGNRDESTWETLSLIAAFGTIAAMFSVIPFVEIRLRHLPPQGFIS